MKTAHQHASHHQQSLEQEATDLQTEIDADSADAEQISKIRIAGRRDAWLTELRASKDDRLKALESVRQNIEGVQRRVRGLQAAVECAGKMVGEREEALGEAKAEVRAFGKDLNIFAREVVRVEREMNLSLKELKAVMNTRGSEK
jgi:chromosome segregation ATPase